MKDRKRNLSLLTWFRFLKIFKKSTSDVSNVLQVSKLSQGQFDLLTEIASDEGLNQQACAVRLQVTKGNIGQHMINLEEKGLVNRKKNGRNNNIYLTVKGRELFYSIMPDHDQYIKNLLSSLNNEELSELSKLLRKIGR